MIKFWWRILESFSRAIFLLNAKFTWVNICDEMDVDVEVCRSWNWKSIKVKQKCLAFKEFRERILSTLHIAIHLQRCLVAQHSNIFPFHASAVHVCRHVLNKNITNRENVDFKIKIRKWHANVNLLIELKSNERCFVHVESEINSIFPANVSKCSRLLCCISNSNENPIIFLPLNKRDISLHRQTTEHASQPTWRSEHEHFR